MVRARDIRTTVRMGLLGRTDSPKASGINCARVTQYIVPIDSATKNVIKSVYQLFLCKRLSKRETLLTIIKSVAPPIASPSSFLNHSAGSKPQSGISNFIDRYDFARTLGFPDVRSDFPDVSSDFPDGSYDLPDVSGDFPGIEESCNSGGYPQLFDRRINSVRGL